MKLCKNNKIYKVNGYYSVSGKGGRDNIRNDSYVYTIEIVSKFHYVE